MKYEKGVKVTSRCGNKSGPKVVIAEVDIEIFETLEEMEQFLGSRDKILELANTQYATNVKNDLRRVANTSAPSDKKLRDEATANVTNDRAKMRELVMIEDEGEYVAAKERMIAEEMETLREKYETLRKGLGKVADEDGDEDGDDAASE